MNSLTSVIINHLRNERDFIIDLDKRLIFKRLILRILTYVTKETAPNVSCTKDRGDKFLNTEIDRAVDIKWSRTGRLARRNNGHILKHRQSGGLRQSEEIRVVQ